MRRFSAHRAITMGVLLGTLLACSPGSVFIAAVVFVTARWLRTRFAGRERAFVVGIFVAGFLLRAAVSLGLDAAAWIANRGVPYSLERSSGSNTLTVRDQTRTFAGTGDSDYYSVRSLSLARYVAGARDADAMSAMYKDYGFHTYLYVMAWFYYVFGFSPVAVKFLNCVFGALIGPALYSLVKLCFPIAVARWSSLAVVVAPSLILWSATNLKDIPLILVGLLLLRALLLLWVRTFAHQRMSCLLLLPALLFVHAAMRTAELTGAVLVSFITAIWLTRRIGWAWRVATVVLVVGALVLGHAQVRQGLVRALDVHIGHVNSSGASYRFLPDTFYEADKDAWAAEVKLNGPFLASLGHGVAQYLMQPVAWSINSGFQLLAYPQMVAWYMVLGFAVWGAGLAFAERRFGQLFLLLVAASWTGLGALTNGNAGTVFRMRDMVSPLYLAFGFQGLWSLLRDADR